MLKRKYKSKMLLFTGAIALALTPFASILNTHAESVGHAPYTAKDVIWHTDAEGNRDFRQGSSTQDGFGNPMGIAIDTTRHLLFTTDRNIGRILVFQLDATNRISSFYAKYVLNTATFGEYDQGTSQSDLFGPEGLYFDQTTDRLFVADSANSRILVYETYTMHNNMDASYVIGQNDFSTKTRAAGQNGLEIPTAVTYDTTDKRLFVADTYNNRVLTYDLSSGITNGMSAEHVLGQPDFDADSPQRSELKLRAPGGLAYDSTNKRLFVSDTENNRIITYDLSSGVSDSMTASNVIGQDDMTAFSDTVDQKSMRQPRALAYEDSTKRLFVSDTYGNRILMFDLSGGVINGMDASNVIGKPNFTSGNIPTSQKSFSQPGGMVYDPTMKQLFVSSLSESRVLSFDLSAGVSDYPSANGVLGQHNGDNPVYTSSQNMNYQNAPFTSPQATLLDKKNHRLFISGNSSIAIYQLDSQNQIVSRRPAYELGKRSFESSQNGFIASLGLTYDESRDFLYVTDSGNNRVLVFDLSGGITNQMNASYVIGQPDFTSTNYATDDHSMQNPSSSVLDKNTKYLYVSDTGNNRVLVFNTNNLANNMQASYVIGQPDFTTNDMSGPSKDLLKSPSTLALDTKNHRLYVGAGSYFMPGLMLYNTNALSNGLPASNYIGKESFSDTSFSIGKIDSKHFISSSVAIDEDRGRIFAGDRLGRVLVFNTSDGITDAESAVDLIGQSDYTAYTYGQALPTQSGFGDSGIQSSYDSSSHTLYLSDYGNNRVLLFDVNAGTPPPENPDSSNSEQPSYSPADQSSDEATSRRLSYLQPASESDTRQSITETQDDSSQDSDKWYLNDKAEYANGSGYDLDVTKDTVLYFKVNDNEYSLKVSDIQTSGNGAIGFTILETGETFTIQKGQRIEKDINIDNRSDITIRVNSFTNDKANLRIAKIVSPQEHLTQEHDKMNSGVTKKTDANTWWIVAVVIGIIVMVAVFTIGRTLAHSKKQ